MMALLYLGIKFLAYSFWCSVGLSKLRHKEGSLLARSFAFGLLRLLMGFFFGALIWFLGSLLMSAVGFGLPQNVLTYVLVYLPVRWVEWTIMAILIVPGSFPAWRWAAGTASNDRLWRLGGIVISCLADIPLIWSLGGAIPTGRFLC